MSSYFYYVPCYIFLLSQVPLISLSGSFGSSPKWWNSPSSPEAPMCNCSHYDPLLQRVPWKSRIRRIPSIMPSLRTQKLGSRWQTPKHSWTALVGMPTTPLLASTQTSPLLKLQVSMVLILCEEILLNEIGKWQHFPWLVGCRTPGSTWKRFSEVNGC